MPYTALSFTIRGDAAEAWGDALLDAGALAVEATDADAGSDREVPQFAEPGEPGFVAWSRSRMVALFDGDAEVGEALTAAAAALGCSVPAANRWPVEEQDWVRATQAQFGPIRIAEDFHVVPTWSPAPARGTVLRLDPGLAFGTGSHPTTRLCLEWLHETVRGGESVLDYGCGSGILAIAAKLLGGGAGAGDGRRSAGASRQRGQRRAPTGSRRASSPPMRCRRGRTRSSSPTSSPIRWSCSRPRSPRAWARAGASPSPESSSRKQTR